MSKYDINVTIQSGRLTNDPRMAYTPKGTAVAEFSMAVNERQGTGDQAKDVTTFVDVVQYGPAAEATGKMLRKGSGVTVRGRLKLDQWDDKTTGQKRTKLRVIADQVVYNSNYGNGNGNAAPQSEENIPE